MDDISYHAAPGRARGISGSTVIAIPPAHLPCRSTLLKPGTGVRTFGPALCLDARVSWR